MIRTSFILLLVLLISGTAMAGGRKHCAECCRYCKMHTKHMARVEHREMCKEKAAWKMNCDHSECCSNFCGGKHHDCGYDYEYNVAPDYRRMDQGRMASYGYHEDGCYKGDDDYRYKKESSYSDHADYEDMNGKTASKTKVRTYERKVRYE